MHATPRLFISYAREDGEAFASALRKRIENEEPELTVWQDRAAMEGGVGWWRQIEEALAAVRFLVLVMTPAAMRSANTRKEWRYARQQGVSVCPVNGAPDAALDFDSLPRWMSKAHIYDLEHEWDTFIWHLKSPPRSLRVPFMAPDLPQAFVERPALSAELLHLFLDARKGNPVAITTGLQGAGGLGKTTMAAAICHNDDVITAYDDGILWVTLGETPNLLGGVTKLYAALTGERPGFVDLEDASVNLAEKLEGKNCLIVVDDIWDAAHLRPFLRGGANCARLITTRRLDLALEADHVTVDTMISSEAVQLLTRGLQSTPDAGPFRELADRLGNWPLLLELAAAAMRTRVRAGDTVTGALHYVTRKLVKHGVTAFDQSNPHERHQAFARTIDISFEALAAEEREFCLALAVFPEDVQVPLDAAATLWGLDEFSAEEIVTRLAGLSLLTFQIQIAALRLHDVVRQYLLQKLRDPALLHARLTDAWGAPQRLPHQYAWTWFGYHLVGAERKERLRTLLLDFLWLQAKLDATDVGSLLEEFGRFAEDAVLGLVRDALRLSAHVVSRDKTQLAGQLLARLPELESPEVAALRDGAGQWRGRPWFRPLSPVMTPPGGPLLFTLPGHKGRVLSVAVIPDGRRAVSASDDHDLKVWDLVGGAEERTLAGHRDWVRAVAISSDGLRAVSASDDHTLIVWNIETGAREDSLSFGAYWPRALALAPNGRYAVLALDRGLVQVWDLERRCKLPELEGHSASVNAVAVAPDGRFAFSASDDRTVRAWDLRGEEARRVLRGHTAKVNAVAVTGDGLRLVTASSDETLRSWDWRTNTESRIIANGAYWVRGLAVTRDGRLAVCAVEDGVLRIWDIASGNLDSKMEGHADWATAVGLSSDGQIAVSASADRTLKVWNLFRRGARQLRAGHNDRVRLVCFTPDGRRLLSSSDDRTLREWDFEGLAETRRFSDQSHWPFALAPDGTWVASASGDATIRLWDLQSATTLETLFGHSDRVRVLMISPDGRCVISASDDLSIRVWDVESGKCRLQISLRNRAWVRCMAVTPDCGRLVTGAEGPLIKVWDLESGREAGTLAGHSARINSLAMSPDGRCLLSAWEDSFVGVWDLASFTLRRMLSGHAAAVHGVATLEVRPYAVTAAADFALRFWNYDSGDTLAAFTGESPFRCCAIGPRGGDLAAGDDAGRICSFRMEGLEP